MKRLTVGAAIASLVTVGAAAGPVNAKPKPPKPSPRAHVYWANLGPVAVGPYGEIPSTRGRAQLVDGKRNDKLSIHVRGLQAGQTYTWHIHKAAAGVADPCASPAATAASAPGWIYRPLTANTSGNGDSQARSFTFSADPAGTYYVDVHMGDGSVLVCGVLHGKPAHPKPVHPLKGKGKGAHAVAGGQASADGDAGDPIEIDAEGDGDVQTGDTTTGTQAPATQPGDDQGENNDGDGEDWGKKQGPRRPHHGGHGQD